MERKCYKCGKSLKIQENSHTKKCCNDIDYKTARYNQLLFDFKDLDLSFNNIEKLYLVNGYSMVDFKKIMGLSYRATIFLLDYYNIKKSDEQTKKEKTEKHDKCCQSKYGINHSTTKEVLEKIKKTNIEKFGVDNIFKDEKFISESREKKIKKYGKAGLGWINENDDSKKERVVILHNNLRRWWKNMNLVEKEFRLNILKDNRLKWWNELSESDKMIFIENLKDNYDSKLELRIINILEKNNIIYETQCWINRLSYDIKINNVLLEINGDFWHCNPNKYEENYIHPHIKKSSKEIWEKDINKKLNAEKYGYNVLYLWEDYINKNNDDDIFIHIKSFIKSNEL